MPERQEPQLTCIYCGKPRGFSDYGCCKECERRMYESFYDDVPWLP